MRTRPFSGLSPVLTSAASPPPMPSGPVAAALAYILWGLFPLYIKQVAQLPVLEIVLHRSAGSLMFASVPGG